jgi:hypothetical protein
MHVKMTPWDATDTISQPRDACPRALEDTPALHIFIRFRRACERYGTQLRHSCLTQQGENGYILLIKILVKNPCYERDRKDIQIPYPSPTSQYLQFLIR